MFSSMSAASRLVFPDADHCLPWILNLVFSGNFDLNDLDFWESFVADHLTNSPDGLLARFCLRHQEHRQNELAR